MKTPLSLLVAVACMCTAQAGFFDLISSFFGYDSKVNAVVSQTLSSAEVDVVLNNAKSLILSQEFDKAVNVLLPLIDNDPDDKDANLLLGSTFLALNRADLAETFLHHAVKLTDWNDVVPISNLAEAIRLNGDIPLATKVLQKGYMAMNNSDPSGQLAFEFGTIQEHVANYTAAADWYLSSALSDKTNSRAWLKASTLLFPDNHWDLTMAENVLATAIQNIPDDPMLLFNLGVVLHYTNRINEASILYAEALRFDPVHYPAISNLATALHTVGRTDEAKELYNRVYEATVSPLAGQIINPFSGTATTLGNYALLLSAQKKYHQASAMAVRAVQLEPENKELLSLQEKCIAESSASAANAEQTRLTLADAILSGSWDRGLDILIGTGVPAEDDAWWYFTKGMVHYFRGENELALQYCSVALEHSMSYMSSPWLTNPSEEAPARPSHMIHGCIGVANQYLGRHEAAVVSFSESLETLRYMSPLVPSPVRVHVLPSVGFSMNQQDVTFNLLIALRNSGNYSQCLVEGFRGMAVNPDLSEGGALILMLSFVDWDSSPTLRDAIAAIEKREIASGRLSLPEGSSLLSEIQRVQRNYLGILTPTFECFDQIASSSKLAQSWRDHSSTILMQTTAGAKASSSDENGGANEDLVLITQYFHSQDQPTRDALVAVLSKNLRDSNIAEVALINDQEYNFAALQSSEKVKQYISGKRLTFSDAFRVANNFYPNRNVIISNSDIFFDETLKNAMSAPLNGTLVALSKWSSTREKISLSLRTDSQDAWIFRTPVPDSIIAQSNFFLGAPRCDNRIAKLFYDAGYKIVNPTFSIHAIESTSLEVQRALMYGVEHAVRGQTAHVLLSDASAL